MNLFDGLYGYESVMLVCGFVLFIFTLGAITVMLAQRRSFKVLLALLPVAIVLMGFPGIQSLKFSQDTVEIDRARMQPQPEMTAAQKQQYTQALTNVEQRSAGNPLQQAKVADGYRAIGEVDKAYDVAQSVLAKDPPATASKLLVPVLTAKLEQSTPPLHATGAAQISATRQNEIAKVASQLQAQTQAVHLSADSHVALAKAYVVTGDAQRARINVDAARRIDPRITISASLRNAIRQPPVPSAEPGH